MHIDANFDITFLVTIIWDIKIDTSMCEPRCANLFFVNLLHSLGGGIKGYM